MKNTRSLRYSSYQPSFDRDTAHRKLRNNKGRSIQQNIVASLVWPFLFAVEDLFTFPKRRAVIGFVLFCGFAGLTFFPQFGSDGFTYASKIYWGFGAEGINEPITAFLINMVSFSGFGYHFYFMLLGLIYAALVSWSAYLLFSDLPVNKTYSTATAVFMLAFFLNHPVFAALNARYQLSLWVMLLSTILILKGRWQISLCIALMGTMIHFGHSIFFLALVLLLLSRKLGKVQIIFAYVMLVVAIFLPSSLLLTLGDTFAHYLGGSFSEKVSNTAKIVQQNKLLSTGEGSEDSKWFMVWFEIPIFYSLLFTGHMLVWKIRNHQSDPQFQLWILIIFMWALQFAMRGDSEGAGRVERNNLALLLMWHARWFLYRRQGKYFALFINIAPMIFYFIIAFRRDLNDVHSGTFLPSFFSYFTGFMPTVQGFFKLFH